jgi:hypothetical protein
VHRHSSPETLAEEAMTERPLAEMAVRMHEHAPTWCRDDECRCEGLDIDARLGLFVPLAAAEEAVREAREAGAIEALTAVYGERENDQAQIVRAHVLSSIRSEAKP